MDICEKENAGVLKNFSWIFKCLIVLAVFVCAMVLLTPKASAASASMDLDIVRTADGGNPQQGSAAGMFSPNSATTRGMILTILWRLAGSPVGDAALGVPRAVEGDRPYNQFSDVPEDRWYI